MKRDLISSFNNAIPNAKIVLMYLIFTVNMQKYIFVQIDD